MATPTALVAGMARAALDGILIRGADVLEALSRVTTVAFDKTGTITSGRPQVQEVVRLGDIGEREVVKLAASAEMLSSHPLARAFSSRARTDGIELESPKTFEVVAGAGAWSPRSPIKPSALAATIFLRTPLRRRRPGQSPMTCAPRA